MQVHGYEWALVAATVLVLCFHAVVQSSVRQGAERRADTARQTEAWSVCDRLHGRAARDRCRAAPG